MGYPSVHSHLNPAHDIVQVRRFVRYTLGEGLEKRSNDFAAEVAAQTARAD